MPDIKLSGPAATKLRRHYKVISTSESFVQFVRPLLLTLLGDALARKENQQRHEIILPHQILVGIARWAAISRTLSESDAHSASLSVDLTLESLLKGSSLDFPVIAKEERSAELIESIRTIELAQQMAEYESMIAPFHSREMRVRVPWASGIQDRTKQQEHNEAEEWLEVRKQLSAIINIAISVVAVAVSVWWAGGSSDPIWKTLVAFSLCLLTVIAEVVLYSRHWSNARKRKKNHATQTTLR